MSITRPGRNIIFVLSFTLAAFGFCRLKLRGDTWPVVLTGQLAPGTASGRFTALSQATVNSSGATVFSANLDVGGIRSAGIFQVAGSVLSPVALEGQTFPDTANRSFGGQLGDPQINNVGDIVFTANYAAGISVQQGIFLSSSGTLRKLLDTTQAAPGASGQTFSSFGNVLINDSGDVAFAASLSGGSASSGLYMVSSGSVRSVVNTTSINTQFSLNNRGDIAFIAQGGVSLASNGSIQTVVASGQAIPNSNLRVFSPAWVSINDDRDVVFVNYSPGGSGRGGTQPTANGIVRSRRGTLEQVVTGGDAVPGIAGGTFQGSSFAESKINQSGLIFTGRKAANGEVADVIARSQASGLSIVASADQVVEGLGLLSFIGEPNFDNLQGPLVTFVANLGNVIGIFTATQSRFTLQLPQIADGMGSGGGWRTTFVFANRSTAPASATVSFYDDNGAPMGIGIGGQQKTQHVIGTPALGVAQFQTDGTSALRTGWAMVESGQSLSGIALFAFSDGAGSLINEVGAPASTALRSFSVFVQAGGSTSTGIAIANPNTVAASVTLILRDSNANELARSSIAIAPMGHLAKYAGELFAGIPSTGFEGKIEVISTVPLVALTLRQRGQIFTSLPVIP